MADNTGAEEKIYITISGKIPKGDIETYNNIFKVMNP